MEDVGSYNEYHANGIAEQTAEEMKLSEDTKQISKPQGTLTVSDTVKTR